MEKYNHKKIEAKWQKFWAKEKLYKTSQSKNKPKYFILDMFPYPSGAGLHVGHPKGYIATDIFARAKMMQGYNVLHPMGWDAFGLPAENYAIANKIHPRIATEKNIKVFKGQLEKLGFTYDWDREINTTDPEFYKWTQWIFLKMFERGLAYESCEPINWCPGCQTGLSNEDLEDGKCERCGSEIERKPMRQWVLKITDYAERMLNDLEKLPYWEESIKEMQKNWIGKSEGAEVEFKIDAEKVTVFTTRPDTLFGATFMVIAPEHPLVKKITTEKQKIEVEKYVKKATGKSDLERTEMAKEKTGVFTGAYAINPVNQEKIPVYIADYVMMGYGTGAIMAVPAHDHRDWEFAKKYNIPIKQVVAPYFSIDSGVDAVRSDKKIVKRYTAYSFVKHCKKDEYLCLDWEKFGWHSGIIGGVDQGEDPIESAKREIREETGYKNIRLIKDMDMETHNNFYAAHKNENRYAFGPAFLFELIDEEQESTSEEHTKNHQAVWIKGKDMATFLNLANFIYLWKVLQGQESFCFTDNGVAINSGFLNNLETLVAKERMITWLEEKKLGKRSVNYKIKDWVFSRQRYWGEPIPIVHCEKCGKKKERVLILHGWEDSSQAGFIPSLKEDLEKKGYEVFAIDLPDTDYPVFDAWYNYVENKIKELNLKHFHIVGHSMGGHLSLKLAEKYDLASLTLVAPVGFNPSEKYYTHFKEKLSIKEIKIFKKYQSQSLDVDKVKNNVKNINFIFGGKDPWITKEIKDYYVENFQNYADIVVLDNYGHMSKSEGVKKLEPLEKLFSISSPGVVAVPEDQLPVLLPEVKNYEPSGTGESPLANIKDWVNTKCPKCGGPGKRETNTMPQWAGSSWYYLRYIDPHNNKALVDKKKDKYWSPVDFYVGGAEHATRHLIYARFWHKFLFDIGAVNYDEPFTRLQHVGLILAEDGRKMSKRWHNVINPDEIVEKYGADAMRVYEMFMGPFKEPCAWSTNGLIGARRFLENVCKLKNKKLYDCRGAGCEMEKSGLPQMLHKTIKKVSEDIENFHYNTAIAQMMIFVNFAAKLEVMPRGVLENFLKLLAPFAPHLAEELWAGLGHKQSIFKSDWPKFNLDLIKDETINLVIQINGKVRDIVEVSAYISEKEAKKIALESEKVKKWLEGKEAKKIIFVKGRLVNIVI